VLTSTLLALAFVSPTRLYRDGEPLPVEAVQRLGSLRFLVNRLSAAAFSPDGKTVYTVSAVGAATSPALIAWEVPSGKKLWQAALGRELDQVAADPDGKSVWVISLRIIDESYTVERVRYSAADGKESGRVTLDASVVAGGLHPTGRVAWCYADSETRKTTLRVSDTAGDTVMAFQFDTEKYGEVRNLNWSPKADRVYVSTENTWTEKRNGYGFAVDVAGGKVEWECSVVGRLEWRVLPGGKRLVGCVGEHATGDERRPRTVACCWDAETGKRLGRLNVPGVRPMDFMPGPERTVDGHLFLPPDGKTMFLHDEDDRTVAIDVATWKTVPAKCSFPEHIVFSPDGRSYLAPWGRHAGVYNTATGKRLSPHETGFSWDGRDVELRFSADGERVVRTGWMDFPRLEWTVDTGEEVRRTPWKEAALTVGTERGLYPHFDTNPNGVCLSADGKKQAKREKKGGEWRILVTLTGKTNAPPVVLDVPLTDTTWPFDELLFTPDSRHLIGYHDGVGLHVWDTSKSGKPVVAKFTDSGHTGPTHPRYKLELSPDGQRVAALERNGPAVLNRFVGGSPSWTLSIFALPSAELAHRYTGEGSVGSFGWTGQGEVAGVVDRTPPGDPFSFKKETPKFEVICLDPDGKKKRVFTPEAIPTCFAVSPVGGMVAIGSKDGLRLYETRTGRLRHTFREQTRPVEVLAFSPNGRHLAAESVDGPLLVWDVRGDLTRPAKPDAAGWDRAWEALADVDAVKAFAAVRLFALHPDDGVFELKRRFAEGPPTAEEITAAVAQLDDRTFAVRQRTERQLRTLGTAAFPALKKAMARDPSEEFKERAGRLLAVEIPADQLRAERAVEAMRWADTEAANKLLGEWAGGDASSPLTVAAKRR
jgi:WD40 repeat protein